MSIASSGTGSRHPAIRAGALRSIGALLALELLIAVAVPGASRAETVLFLVAEPEQSRIHGDSYVLPLEDPGAIAHARELIAHGPAAGETIAVAEIAAGGDGVNRDLLDPQAPAWSWHVTDFVGFADFTIEILDGWPAYVQSDVAGWIANTGGQIGFWSYTVVRELPGPTSGGMTACACLTLAALRRLGRRGRRGARPRRSPPACARRAGAR